MKEGSQGQAKRSPWEARVKSRALKGARDRGCPASLQDAICFFTAFQALRFACAWLPSDVPSGLNSRSRPSRAGRGGTSLPY